MSSLQATGLIHKEKSYSPEQGDLTNRYHLTVTQHPATRAEYGFRPLNTTPVPDELFDYWLDHLSDAELRVLIYIVRHTLGWRKAGDVISPGHFKAGIMTRDGHVVDEGCGVRTDETLYKALAGLEVKTLIQRTRQQSPLRGNLPTRYSLVFEGDLPYVLTHAARRTPEDLHADDLASIQQANPDKVREYGAREKGVREIEEGEYVKPREGIRWTERAGSLSPGKPGPLGRGMWVRQGEEAEYAAPSDPPSVLRTHNKQISKRSLIKKHKLSKFR